jgi:Tol biopolymer transport system component
MRRSRRRPHLAALVLAAAGTMALVSPALGAKDDLELVSRATGPAGAPIDGSAVISSISASGARVAFDTDADNISAEDVNGVRNVFVRDATTNETLFASRATGAAGAGGDGASQDPSISGDGRFVAFESTADNLSTEDDNTVTNVFVRDLVTGTTVLVSRASGPGGAGGNGTSVDPDVSSDGRYVVFESTADNLSADDDNTVFNIFVRDLVANTTTLVSRTPGLGGAGANDNSFNPAISGDGNRVVFQSGANNLSNDDDNTVTNVFVRDLAAGANALVSRATGVAGVAGDGGSSDADISPSGRYVTFLSASNNLSAEDDNAVTNVFLRDLDQSTTALVSRADGPGGAGANASAVAPVVSDNARVAFWSNADNLSAFDNDAFASVVVRDALAGTTELVSRGPGPANVAADQGSFLPATSADGRFVAFQSLATNLIAGTVPGIRNIYRRDVLGAAPIATPVCKTLPLPPTPPAKEDVTFTLTARQLLINQRIGQAAIRRLNAVEARLQGGLQARDLCGYAVGPAQLSPGITTTTAAASLAPADPANPAAINDPGRTGQGDPVTLSARQLLINQRIYQAAIRRADGISKRINDGLTGGDIRAGAVTQGKLFDRLQILTKTPTPEPAASTTVIPPRQGTGNPGAVTLSTSQLRINQRIAQAGVRDANALIRRLETGLTGNDLRLATLTATDLG